MADTDTYSDDGFGADQDHASPTAVAGDDGEHYQDAATYHAKDADDGTTGPPLGGDDDIGENVWIQRRALHR
jgi:hypothetical protein